MVKKIIRINVTLGWLWPCFLNVTISPLIYIYIYICVCVCVCIERERERERYWRLYMQARVVRGPP